MKKLLIAAMAASIVLTFASCGNTKEEAQDENTSTATQAVSEPESEEESSEEEVESEEEESSEEEVESEEEESSEEEVESEEEESSEEEVESEADAEESEADASTDGKLFDVTVGDNWAMTDDAFGNTTITYKGTDIEMAADTCTVLINSQEIPDLNTMSISELGPLFKDSMGMGDALTVNSEEETTFNGYEAYIFDGVYSSMDLDFDLKVIVARNENTLLVVCPMTYSEVTEAIQPEIQKIVDSVKIK